ncbi:MAG: PAS domain S-box protein [Methylobacterium mesophilicum]|nr:PAS domain S-box protein [Methylobacterium mesophilicum]
MSHSKSSPFLERLLRQSLNRPARKSVAYGVTTLIIIGIGVFRALFITALLPYLFYIPAVLGLALVLGKGPGLYASVLAAVVAAISLGDSAQPGWLSWPQWVSTGLFMVVTAMMVVVIAELRIVFARAGRLQTTNDETFVRLAERESFLSSVLASSTDCIKVLDLEGRLTFMSEGGQRVMEVSDFNAIAQCPWPDFWAGKGNAQAIEAVAKASRGISSSFVGRAATMAGTVRWWDVAVSPIFGPDGRPERILSVSRDVTASRESEEERGQLVRIVENSTDFIGMALLDGRVFFMNEAACRLVGLDHAEIANVHIADFFPPEQAERVATEILPSVDRVGGWTGEMQFRHFKTGEPIPVLYSVFPVVDYDGTKIGYGTVTRDFRERKRAEEQQHLLNQEISHRLKNSLALVQAVANQTLRKVTDRDAVDAFEKRLHALGSAHEILLRQNWTTAPMDQVIAKSVMTLGQGERVHLSGPTVELGSRAALSLSLLVHELTTNAMKYGALSNDNGEVRIGWETKDDTVTLHWRESGGPVVRPPSDRGFGSRLIRLGLVGAGGVDVRYPETGFEADMQAPLAHLRAG